MWRYSSGAPDYFLRAGGAASGLSAHIPLWMAQFELVGISIGRHPEAPALSPAGRGISRWPYPLRARSFAPPENPASLRMTPTNTSRETIQNEPLPPLSHV